VAPRYFAPGITAKRLGRLERGQDFPTIPELVHIARVCDAALFDLMPEEAIARTLRTPEEPPALPKAPSIDPSVRVFAVSADATDDEYHPEDPNEIEPDPGVKAIAEKIEASVGMDVIRTTQEVGRSARVLMGNLRELRASLIALADIHSISLWHPANEAGMAAALGEVTRKLHNYVAAAATLRDHAARFIERHYPPGTAQRQEWEAQSLAYFGLPERVLVNQLRNYSVHRALPILRAVHGDDAKGGAATFIVLDVSELLQSEKWAPPVRAWLQERELIDLAEVTSGHWVAVEKFYDWFGGWIRATQDPAMQELQALRREHAAIVDEVAPGLREIFDYLNARKRRENPRQPREVRKILRAASARERRALEKERTRAGARREGRTSRRERPKSKDDDQ
jgi:hypothetical protein